MEILKICSEDNFTRIVFNHNGVELEYNLIDSLTHSDLFNKEIEEIKSFFFSNDEVDFNDVTPNDAIENFLSLLKIIRVYRK